MSDPISDIPVAVATQLVKDSLNSLYEPLSDFLLVKKAQFLEEFSSYCTLIYNKNSLVRTLYSKNKPMSLSAVYVKTSFNQGNNHYSDTSLINKFASGNRIIVKGNGGSGKTIFLKHLWLSRFKNSSGRIPIFVELRRLNDLNSIDISTFCRNELQSDLAFGKGVFEKLCQAGKFEFIFDGFDEVNREHRKVVEQQIISLSEQYRQCCFLVSGREDDRFSSWGDFQIYSVSPLSLEDVRELIEKIPFDSKVKKKFLGTLNKDFYTEHHSFLSSPLLACMMLMTFNENAIIPSKLTEFYKSAFQTLLTWHDATKDSFERDRALSVDDFRNVFSTFCLISYYEQSFEFDDVLFRRYIRKALDYHSVEADIDDVINDICESANLLQKDGLKFLFVHRSFQEYFAAECAMQVVAGKAEEFLNVFSKRTRDTVFEMCYEIHPELVFDQYFSRNLQWLKDNDFPTSSKIPSEWGNPWMTELIQVDCLNLKDQGLAVARVRFENSNVHTNALSLIDLCFRVTNSHSIDPSALLFTSMVECVHNASVASKITFRESTSLKVKVTFSNGSHSLSLRNSGSVKIPAQEMKRFRAKFSSLFTERLKKDKSYLNRYYGTARSVIASLKEERQAKEKSIDAILNLKPTS